MSRLLFRSAVELRPSITRPPAHLLTPLRSQSISQQHATPSGSSTTHSEASIIHGQSKANGLQRTKSAVIFRASSLSATTPTIINQPPNSTMSPSPLSTPTPRPARHPPTHDPLATTAPPPRPLLLLPLLATQPGGHFITILIHGKPYLVTQGDQVRLPFKMPGVVPGDVLRLTRASNLGSRDFTLKGEPLVDPRRFVCRAVVLGTEAEPMREKKKTKRRCRKVKTVRSKHKHTILRISELRIGEGVGEE